MGDRKNILIVVLVIIGISGYTNSIAMDMWLDSTYQNGKYFEDPMNACRGIEDHFSGMFPENVYTATAFNSCGANHCTINIVKPHQTYDGCYGPLVLVTIDDCTESQEWSDEQQACVEVANCEAGIEKYFSGQGPEFYTGPGSICQSSCRYVSESIRVGIKDGSWAGKYKSDGSTCGESQEGNETGMDDPLPPGCTEVNGNILCGAGTENENCGTYNGVEVCTGAEENCGYVNGVNMCFNDEKNCGVVNGEKVCVQSPEPGQWGPQNSAPDGCFQDAAGKTLCVNDDTVKTENTTTETTDNGDGTQTTTTTTETSTNVAGEGTTTTTTISDGQGNSTTTTTMSGNEPLGDGSGSGDGEGDDWGAYQGDGPGDLYEPTEKTYETVLTQFSNRIQAASVVSGVTGFFDVNVSGSCPDWSIPATDMTPAISVNIQCSSAAYEMYGIAGLVVLAMAGFTAFRWAIL